MLSLSLVILFSADLDDGVVNSGFMAEKRKCRGYESWEDQSGKLHKKKKPCRNCLNPSLLSVSILLKPGIKYYRSEKDIMFMSITEK